MSLAPSPPQMPPMAVARPSIPSDPAKMLKAAKDFEAITCALGDKFPVTLDLEGQGRFALGYYHQKAEYRRRTAERKEKDTADAAK